MSILSYLPLLLTSYFSLLTCIDKQAEKVAKKVYYIKLLVDVLFVFPVLLKTVGLTSFCINILKLRGEKCAHYY